MGHGLRRPCPAVEQPLGTNLDRPFQRAGQAQTRVSNLHLRAWVGHAEANSIARMHAQAKGE
jgi:hypothetical protein